MKHIQVQMSDWVKLCNALQVSPDTLIDDVIRKAELINESRRKYAQQVIGCETCAGELTEQVNSQA